MDVEGCECNVQELCESAHPRLYLAIWIALLVIPLLAHELLVGYEPADVTANWLFTKHLGDFVGVCVSGFTALTAPFAPRRFTGDADLTVFVLSLYTTFCIGRALWSDLGEAWRQRELYMAATVLCVGHTKFSSRAPGGFSKVTDKQHGLLPKDVQWRTGHVPAKAMQSWKHGGPHGMVTMVSKLHEEVQGFEPGVPRSRIIGLFRMTVECCGMPYQVLAAPVLIKLEFAKIAKYVIVDDWCVHSTTAFNRAIQGLPRRWTNRQGAWKDADLERSHFQMSCMELADGTGNRLLVGKRGLEGLKQAVDKIDAALGYTQGDGVQHEHELQMWRVVYDQMILSAELLGVSEYLACKKGMKPLAHEMMDRFHHGKLWKHLQDDKRDDRSEEVRSMVWALWMLALVQILPMVVLLTFDVMLDLLEKDSAAEILGACLRGRLGPVGVVRKTELESLCTKFSETEGLGVKPVAGTERHRRKIEHKRMCTEVEFEASRIVFNVAIDHVKAILTGC